MNDWTQNYEKITDMIVPRSSTLITQDADYALFNVTLFKKVRILIEFCEILFLEHSIYSCVSVLHPFNDLGG